MHSNPVHHKQTIARRIMVRLARAYAANRITAAQVRLAATQFLQWPRAAREAWILSHYDDIKRHAHVDETTLAFIVV